MFLKLLLTALVIAGALLTLRMRRQQQMDAAAPAANRTTNSVVSRPAMQFMAIGLVVLMLGTVGFYLYYQWQESYREISLRVVDSRSGEVTLYRARKAMLMAVPSPRLMVVS